MASPFTHLVSASVLLLLAGCAITSSHSVGPNGQPVHFIDAMTASVAYAKAAELCPSGYTMVGSPNVVSPVDYVMTVECKPLVAPARGLSPTVAPATVRSGPTESAVTSPVPAPARAPVTAQGTAGLYAERVARDLGCNMQPRSVLTAKGPGFESYTVACSDGDALAIRCEFGNCRALR
ncbi:MULTISPECIES: hypothetical protein [unclassified Variovorax]|uniref:hypothetical protein n=1 Tax=unclassified Variovorax TaxID=663243 RepID=UPI001BD1F0FD|nr:MULTISPECIES: hypothetical protein [unclassified Variovorax]